MTFWSAWVGDEIVGMGALKRIDEARRDQVDARGGPWLGKGVGRAMLEHIVGEARRMGMTSLWLETEREAFAPALKLYETRGSRAAGRSTAMSKTRSACS